MKSHDELALSVVTGFSSGLKEEQIAVGYQRYVDGKPTGEWLPSQIRVGQEHSASADMHNSIVVNGGNLKGVWKPEIAIHSHVDTYRERTETITTQQPIVVDGRKGILQSTKTIIYAEGGGYGPSTPAKTADPHGGNDLSTLASLKNLVASYIYDFHSETTIKLTYDADKDLFHIYEAKKGETSFVQCKNDICFDSSRSEWNIADVNGDWQNSPRKSVKSNGSDSVMGNYREPEAREFDKSTTINEAWWKEPDYWGKVKDLLETGEEIAEVRENMREDRRERKEKEQAEHERKAAEEAERLRQQQLSEQRERDQRKQSEKKSDKKSDKTTSKQTEKSTETSPPKSAQKTATPTQPEKTSPTSSASIDFSRLNSLISQQTSFLRGLLASGQKATSAQHAQFNSLNNQYVSEFNRLKAQIGSISDTSLRSQYYSQLASINSRMNSEVDPLLAQGARAGIFKNL